jgi:tetratricopeptide (TPR) repeat protein
MKKLTMLFYVIILACLSACEKLVEVDLPDSQLTGTAVFQDRNTATAALANTYAKLRGTGFLSGFAFGSPIALGLYTDELTYYGGSGVNSEFLYADALLPTTPIISQLWNDSYHQIYCANAILEGVAGSTVLQPSERDQFKGEALFVRALVHFYLLNVYGDIPYVETTDYTKNRLVSRMPQVEVYQKIVSDLKKAIALLPEDYISAERVRPNRSTAYALLARTYLYMSMWDEASNAASAVINNPAYVWETDLDQIFLKGSSTTIWQLKPGFEGGNTNEASAFIFSTGPPPSLAITNALVNGFAIGDQRKSHWIGTVTKGSDIWHYANKYKANGNTGTSVEYSIIFRLAEQYLIRSEARAHQGQLIGAREDLNKIRNTAGLGDIQAVTANDLISAILEERKFELFAEYGHRFFDLKRTSKLDDVLSPLKPGWNTSDRLWPIPETEMLTNPNLKPQNLGY